jgi:hypothetical protein
LPFLKIGFSVSENRDSTPRDHPLHSSWPPKNTDFWRKKYFCVARSFVFFRLTTAICRKTWTKLPSIVKFKRSWMKIYRNHTISESSWDLRVSHWARRNEREKGEGLVMIRTCTQHAYPCEIF